MSDKKSSEKVFVQAGNPIAKSFYPTTTAMDGLTIPRDISKSVKQTLKLENTQLSSNTNKSTTVLIQPTQTPKSEYSLSKATKLNSDSNRK